MVDATSPCVDTPDGPASYVVFALPAVSARYQITVRSMPYWTAIISPRATIYGADEQPRQEFGEFRAGGALLAASATGAPGDRYVVVTSTPASIGKRQNIPTAAAQPPIRLAAAVFVPIILPVTPDGPTDSAISSIRAHSGVIWVTAVPFVTVP